MVLSCPGAHRELGAEPGLESILSAASQACVPDPGCLLGDYGI